MKNDDDDGENMDTAAGDDDDIKWTFLIHFTTKCWNLQKKHITLNKYDIWIKLIFSYYSNNLN